MFWDLSKSRNKTSIKPSLSHPHDLSRLGWFEKDGTQKRNQPINYQNKQTNPHGWCWNSTSQNLIHIFTSHSQILKAHMNSTVWSCCKNQLPSFLLLSFHLISLSCGETKAFHLPFCKGQYHVLVAKSKQWIIISNVLHDLEKVV